jgi:hypothetical protein
VEDVEHDLRELCTEGVRAVIARRCGAVVHGAAR